MKTFLSSLNLSPYLIFVFFIAAYTCCEWAEQIPFGAQQEDDSTEKEELPLQINLSSDAVQKLVQTHVKSKQLNLKYRERHFTTKTKRVPCSYAEMEYDGFKGTHLAKCKNITPPNYGFKEVRERVEEWKEKNRQLSSLEGEWKALYISDLSKWKVELEVNLPTGDTTLTWLVNDQTKEININ